MPCVRKTCLLYADQALDLNNFDTEWGAEFADWFDRSQKTMNLWELTRSQLQEAGLRHDRIFGLDLCTWSLPERFFSFRRERVCGRQASVIWIS